MASIEFHKKTLSIEADNDERWTCCVIKGNFKLSKYQGIGNCEIDVIVPPYICPHGWVEINSLQSFCNNTERVFVDDGIPQENKLFINIMPNMVTLTSDNDVKEISILSNISWEIFCDDSRLIISPLKGKNNGKLTIKSDYKGEFSYIPIRIKSDLGCFEVFVKKEVKKDDILIATPTNIIISGDNNKFNITIISMHNGEDVPYFISSSNAKVIKDDKLGNVMFEFNKNIISTSDSITEKIEVSNGYSESVIINVIYFIKHKGTDSFSLIEYNGKLLNHLNSYRFTFDKNNYLKPHIFKVESLKDGEYVNWYIFKSSDNVDCVFDENYLTIMLNENSEPDTEGYVILKNDLNQCIDISFHIGDIGEVNDYVFMFDRIVTRSNPLDYGNDINLLSYSKQFNKPIKWKVKSNDITMKYIVRAKDSNDDDWKEITFYKPSKISTKLHVSSSKPDSSENTVWIEAPKSSLAKIDGEYIGRMVFQQLIDKYKEAELFIRHKNKNEVELACYKIDVSGGGTYSIKELADHYIEVYPTVTMYYTDGSYKTYTVNDPESNMNVTVMLDFTEAKDITSNVASIDLIKTTDDGVMYYILNIPEIEIEDTNRIKVIGTVEAAVKQPPKEGVDKPTECEDKAEDYEFITIKREGDDSCILMSTDVTYYSDNGKGTVVCESKENGKNIPPYFEHECNWVTFKEPVLKDDGLYYTDFITTSIDSEDDKKCEVTIKNSCNDDGVKIDIKQNTVKYNICCTMHEMKIPFDSSVKGDGEVLRFDDNSNSTKENNVQICSSKVGSAPNILYKGNVGSSSITKYEDPLHKTFSFELSGGADFKEIRNMSISEKEAKIYVDDTNKNLLHISFDKSVLLNKVENFSEEYWVVTAEAEVVFTDGVISKFQYELSMTEGCTLIVVDGPGSGTYYPANYNAEDFSYIIKSECGGKYADINAPKLDSSVYGWYRLIKTEKYGENQVRVHFHIDENTKYESREFMITISQIDGNAPNLKITVHQSGKNY